MEEQAYVDMGLIRFFAEIARDMLPLWIKQLEAEGDTAKVADMKLRLSALMKRIDKVQG